MEPSLDSITLSWENIDVNLPPPGGCAAKLPFCKKPVKKTHILDSGKLLCSRKTVILK